MTESTLARFIHIRDRADKDVLDDSMVGSSALETLSSAEREVLFRLAHDTWLTVFDRAQLQNDIINADPENALCLRKIKLVRKQGVILSSAYNCFDSRHYVPNHHHKLMKKLGKLNDPVRSDDTHLTNKKNALTALLAYPPLTDPDYLPESNDDYVRFMRQLNNDLALTFQMEFLPIKQFHKARQTFRELMNIMQLRATVSATEEAYGSFKNWFIVSKLLGEIKDVAKTESIEEGLDFSSLTASIEPALLAATLKLLAQTA